MSAAKDLARKKKNYTMGDYIPTKDEQEAYLWGVREGLRIAPKRVKNKNAWYVEIFTKGRWQHSPEEFGPVEVWEQVYKYYKYYYEKNR